MANRICAWCEKYLGPAESELDSHGICPECMARVMPAAGFVRYTGFGTLFAPIAMMKQWTTQRP
jgi:hypothetical protein